MKKLTSRIAHMASLIAAISILSACSRFHPQPGEIKAIHIRDGVLLEMVWIPAGTFLMGSPDSEVKRWASEGPQAEVDVDGFWMGKFEITQAQYEAVMEKNSSGFKEHRNPVELVNWYEAMEFCKKLSAISEEEFTLPTESQWEYACRAGTTTPFHYGNTLSTENANYDGRYRYGSGTVGEYRRKTMPVGSFEPNAFGLHDMHGNVWEWCLTIAMPYPYDDDDGRNNLQKNENRTLRGGCWDDNPEQCRSACRDWSDPSIKWLDGGFRVVLKASEQQAKNSVKD